MADSTLEMMKSAMKEAMRAKDAPRRDTLRMLIATIKNLQIELGREPSEEETLGALSTEAKKRREAAQAYRDGGRDELAAKEDAELGVIEEYLPRQLSEDEVREAIAQIASEVGASAPSDMGKVMGRLMPKLKGRFDGNKARGLVTAHLKGG